MNIDRAVSWEHMLQIHSIIFNIDIVHHQLDAIFESIQLSKLGIISKALLQSAELEFATTLLESQGISIESYDQTYEFLEPITFHNGSDIVFLIKIPKMKPGPYVQLRVETIPLHNKVIAINATNAVIGNNETYLVDNPCVKIENNLICDVKQLFNATDDECLSEILRGNTGNCTFIKTSMKPEVKTIENIGVLIKNPNEPLLFDNDCGFGSRNLTGTLLITFEDCSITINGKQYSNKIFDFGIRTPVLPLHSVNINEVATEIKPIDNLEELHIRNRIKLEHLEKTYNRTQILGYGGTFAIIFIVAAVFIFQLREIRKLQLRLTIRIPASNVEANPHPQSELNRDGSI